MHKLLFKIKRNILKHRQCPFYKTFKKDNDSTAYCPGYYKDKGSYYADDCKTSTLYLSKTCYSCPFYKKYIELLEDENEHNRELAN